MIHKIKQLPGLDKYVIFSIGFTILYSICEFVVSVVTGISHDVLTERIFFFFAGEVVVCGLIKIFKLAPKSTVIEKLESAIGFQLEDTECDDGK